MRHPRPSPASRQAPPSPRAGFTLIEVLVVIGIIAILLSLLVSTLAAARRQARLVACGANLRSIGQACMTHATNNHGYLPLAGRVSAKPTTSAKNYPAGLGDSERKLYT